MKEISNIYSHYHIPPVIQTHQLRVAAVARTIAAAHAGDCDAEVVTQVGLLHDMGNIIKVEFDTFPKVWEPEGVEYWKGVRETMIAQYGKDEHEATVAIAKEIGVSDMVLHCTDMMSFSHIEKVLLEGTLEEQICAYADNRVGPFGVLSLAERLEEAKRRYMYRTDRIFDHDRHAEIVRRAHELEQVLFTGISLQPADITDAHIAPIVEQLSCYTFGTTDAHRAFHR